MTVVLFGLLLFAGFVFLWSLGARDEKAPPILNEQGLPKPFTRGDHEHKEEE